MTPQEPKPSVNFWVGLFVWSVQKAVNERWLVSYKDRYADVLGKEEEDAP